MSTATWKRWLSVTGRPANNDLLPLAVPRWAAATFPPWAVLDPALRVRGVQGLRVVDASVFPTIPAVNPVGTVMVVAERAAELVRRDRAASTPGVC